MKKQKIVITGGLGYIGTELCKLYSGEARFKNIIVIDNKFISERVKQLRDWGIEFIQADILDKKFMNEILSDANIVHHLAGITDVAYTKTESNSEKDNLISKVAIEGTRNILSSIPEYCKIIFPSTHVVFEGFPLTTFNLNKNITPNPVLTYSTSKVENEKDILKNSNPFVILRLGSVYGYSTDTMRINIMPNLFSKMASQNQPIKLFGGGIQYKSLVALIDVARCFKFMAESNNEGIFHLSNENMTVKEVAELCKKHKPLIHIIETNDEIPNQGYTLLNKKLLETGFKFQYNISDCIKEMIDNWSEKEINPELEYIDKGGKEYTDKRGIIRNYELTEPINLIGYIESKKGSVRANHYHPIQEQKCLLISGKYISVIKDLSIPNAPIKTQLIKPGDIAVIKPNVAHTMVFLEDSVFLNLVRGEREHENYGITHTIPYILVDEEFRKDLIENYKTDCRSCGKENLKPVISLGMSPLANNLLNSKDEKDELFPLEMMYCPHCHNCQLSYTVPSNKMFDNYLYTSSTMKSFREHFEKTAEKYIKEFNLTKKSVVVDIGSNDGIALKPLQNKGINVVGIEPAENIAKIARINGITTIQGYFNHDLVNRCLNGNNGTVDLITASNVFAHADNLKEITNTAFSLLKPGGTFIIEVQYLLDTIKDLTFDNIYHEHVNYWSVTSLNNFFHMLDYYISKVEHIDTHGGSIRVYVKRIKENKIFVDKSVSQFLNDEIAFGLQNYQTYLDFAKRVENVKLNVIKNIDKIKEKGESIVGYGSPAKATTSLNYYGLSNKDILYTIEDNKLKQGKIIPGVKLPIEGKEKIDNEGYPDNILVLAWNFFEDIKKNNQNLIDKGVKFINIKDLQNENYIQN